MTHSPEPRNGRLVRNEQQVLSQSGELAGIVAELLIEAESCSRNVLEAIERRLTSREKVVLAEFLRVPDVKQVGLRLRKREQTIRNQLGRVREKLSANSLAELVVNVLLAHIAVQSSILDDQARTRRGTG